VLAINLVTEFRVSIFEQFLAVGRPTSALDRAVEAFLMVAAPAGGPAGDRAAASVSDLERRHSGRVRARGVCRTAVSVRPALAVGGRIAVVPCALSGDAAIAAGLDVSERDGDVA
jgi:hypothetical protein